MAKTDKKDHKNMASDLVKGLIENTTIPPMQETVIVKPKDATPPTITTDKFTVEIESTLMDDVRLYGVKNKIKLRRLFEESLREYLVNHGK